MRSEPGVLSQGLAVLGRAIRDEPRIFAFAVTGSCMFGLATVATAYVIGDVVGDVIEPAFAHHRVDVAASTLGALAILGIAAIRVLGIFGRRLGAGAMQYRLQARYRRAVTRRYLELPLAWHQRHATGTLLSNANADVEAAWYPIAPLPFAVGTVVMLIGAVVSLFVVDWALALVSCAVFPGLFGANFWYARRMSPRISHAQQLRAEVSAAAHESFDGALVVKTMGRETYETERFAIKAAELRSAMINVGRVRGLFDPILDALPSLGTLAVLIVGGVRLRQGAVSLPEVISVAFLFSVLAVPVRAIGFVLGELPRAAVGFGRVANVLAATGQMNYGITTLDSAGDGPVDLRFEHVSFAYPSGPPVLRDVTFTVPAGATVAVVGPTGAGKSTIASLAVRLMDPADGRILLGGTAIAELSAASLADTVALVPQVPFVFDDTVAGNVALERAGIDDETVAEALRVAQAERFVAALPAGTETGVGERGTTLSGGQRQRLTLARALAGRPRVLVIDDATSAVDPRVEGAILAALRDRTRGSVASILVVAYRRATIALADLVVYVESGRVVATGTHEELLATVGGYAALVTAYETAEQDAARVELVADGTGSDPEDDRELVG
ncbi:MAG TPA: ABC transporter ATP-binding protein [Micromonosporaceae bacterium]|nr:ABC transporter ATP-binding protein [Micromonosporaceae bacterium]